MFHDWLTYFDGSVPPWYPPWTGLLLDGMTIPVLLGLTLVIYGIAVLKRASGIVSAICAFLVLPLFWVLYIGQVEVLAVAGTLAWWLAPLTLTKPHVALFSVLSDWRAMAMVAAAVVIACVAFGTSWLLEMPKVRDGERLEIDLTLGRWGWVPALLIGLGMPKDDPDWWMLVGALLTPRLLPYNMLPLFPAAARLHWGWAIAVVVTSWLPLLANWVGPAGWWLAWVSVGLLALGMWEGRKDGKRLAHTMA